jgi:hypothetical protein
MWTTRAVMLRGFRQFQLGVHWKVRLARILLAWRSWSARRGALRRAVLAMRRIKLHDGLEMWHRLMAGERASELRLVLLQRYYGRWLWWPWAEKARRVTLDTVFRRWGRATLGMAQPTRALLPCKCVRALSRHSQRGLRARRLRALRSAALVDGATTTPVRSAPCAIGAQERDGATTGAAASFASVPFLLRLATLSPSRAKRREARRGTARRHGDGFECMAEQHARNRAAATLRVASRQLTKHRAAPNARRRAAPAMPPLALCVACAPSPALSPSPRRRYSRFSRRVSQVNAEGDPESASAVAQSQDTHARAIARSAHVAAIKKLLVRRRVGRAMRRWMWSAAVGLGTNRAGCVESKWTMPQRAPLRPVHVHLDLEDVRVAIGRWFMPAVMGTWLARAQHARNRVAGPRERDRS